MLVETLGSEGAFKDPMISDFWDADLRRTVTRTPIEDDKRSGLYYYSHNGLGFIQGPVLQTET